VAQTPPGLNHVRAQDSLDQLRARLGQEQFEQVQAEARRSERLPVFLGRCHHL